MLTWLGGLLRRRAGRLTGAAVGAAVAVALLASLAAFLGSARASMTARATATVPIDWQVQLAGSTDAAAATGTVTGQPGVKAALPVGYAHLPALSAASGQPAVVHTTGAAVVLGIPDGYRAAFPTVMRTLTGADDGVLLAQQTASNLHAAPGSQVTVERPGLPPATVTVAGVIDLPHADAMFAPIGAAPGTGTPTAPPDNVLLLPSALYHRLLDPLGASRPDLLATQLHVVRSHALPPDPATAYTVASGAARHLDVDLAGAGKVGDNLGAALDAARADAAYASILFLFLALPGSVLAGLLTAAVVAAGAARRRAEQSLMRTRGATARRVLGVAALEAGAVGVAGTAVGLGVAAAIGRTTSTGSLPVWLAAAAAGLLTALAAVLLPAWRDLRRASVAAGRIPVGRGRQPLWHRLKLDLVALAGAGLVIWATAGSGYQLVLAPEGAPRITVDYWAFAGPALLWIGAALLAWRLAELALRRGRPVLAAALRPLAGPLSGTVAASLSRQRRAIATAVALLSLAWAFAASTGTFNATYAQQAEVDARLTNGADVTVTEPPSAAVAPATATALATIPGVRHVEPLQHRFAYVGADLQDMYGVDPSTVAGGARLSDAYFAGGTAKELMSTMAAQPDGVLVSAETVSDFQLSRGDQINLRLTDARTGKLATVKFHYLGVVKEFPTAPTDSFLIANSSYLAHATGSPAVGAFLIDTGGKRTAAVAAAVRDRLGPGPAVSDLSTTRGTVGSSLTAVDLSTLTRLELTFAVLLAAAAGGLVLALGLAERRRMFTIAGALGATRRHIAGFVVGEALVIVAGALILAGITGWLVAQTLVTVLHGVFDPPPDQLAIPWPYLAGVFAGTVAAIAGTVAALLAKAGRPALGLLRHG